MSAVKRGGLTLKSGKIGRVNCIRQQIMMPGERMNVNLSGTVKLETLRERESMRINAHLGVFMTPLRWLWPEFPDYIKEGPGTAITPPIKEWNRLSDFGIGSFKSEGLTRPRMFKFWRDAVYRIYNEWYKWPEAADLDDLTEWNADGEPAVPLSKAWTRARFERDNGELDDTTVPVVSSAVDVRTLASRQARFRSMMKRDVLSFNRWMELIRETYDGDGSREVDQVPIMIDQVEVGVNPRELPATDGASLGQFQSLYDFGIDHSIRGIVAPEHCILSYMLTLRFAPIIDGLHPMATDDNTPWHTLTADPEYLSSALPQAVSTLDFAIDRDINQPMGYLPAGWQWRAESDVIGFRIDELDSFPYMLAPTNQADGKDASRVKNAFRSERLGDYLADIYVKEESTMPIGTSMDSYFSGMTDDAINIKQTSQEFPKGGKSL